MMTNYLEKFKKNFNKEMMLMILPIILTILCLFSFLHFTLKKERDTQSVRAQLNTVEIALNQLSYHNQNPEDFKNTLSSISNNITSLQKSVDQSAKSSDVNKIATQITVITQNISELKK